MSRTHLRDTKISRTTRKAWTRVDHDHVLYSTFAHKNARAQFSQLRSGLPVLQQVQRGTFSFSSIFFLFIIAAEFVSLALFLFLSLRVCLAHALPPTLL